ncbi:unnamed protein product [Sympodiomycopsis kandeliae]
MSATTSTSTTHLPLFSPLSPLSTKVLSLSGFSSDLKTRDIQSIFATWEDERGGFKIKWINDTNALIIFNDASIAKKAYLHTLMASPIQLANAKVRPYDGNDASTLIASVSNRARSRSNTHHTNNSTVDEESSQVENHLNNNLSSSSPIKSTRSTNGGSTLGHRRHQSGSNTSIASASLPAKPVAAALYDAAHGGPSPARHLANAAVAEEAAAAKQAQEDKNVLTSVVKEEEDEEA